MIPRTVKTIYEGAGVKGIKRAPKEVLERIAGKLNAVSDSRMRSKGMTPASMALEPRYTSNIQDVHAAITTGKATRPRVVMRDGEAFLVLHRGVSSGGKQALSGSKYQGKWADVAQAPGFPASTHRGVAKIFAGDSPTKLRKQRSAVIAKSKSILEDPGSREYLHPNDRAYHEEVAAISRGGIKRSPDLKPSSRGKMRMKKPRPNIGAYLLPESKIDSAWVRPQSVFGPEWEVRHPQVGDHLVRNKKYYSAKLRLREFSALRKRIRVEWRPRAVGDPISIGRVASMKLGGREIGRIESTGLGQIKWSEIDPRFRGMGLATKMYGEAMKKAPRGRIVSDNAQYAGGAAIWNKLQRNKGYKIRENPKVEGSYDFDGIASIDQRPLFIGRINPAARSKNLSAKLRLRELAEKFHLPYSVAKKAINKIKGQGVSIVRVRNQPSNVGYRGWEDVPVAKIERGSNRSPFADLLHEAGHVNAGHLGSKIGSKSGVSERSAELLKVAEGYYPRAHHESSDDILNAARGVLLREKQANRAAGKILKSSGAPPEQISAFAKEQRKNFRTYRKNAWRHAVAGERIKNSSATESAAMGFLQKRAERRGVIPSEGALRSARDTVQRQIRSNPINRGLGDRSFNESFNVDGTSGILPLTISEAKKIHKNTSKLWRVQEYSAKLRLRELAAKPAISMSLSTARNVLGRLKAKNALHSGAPLSAVRNSGAAPAQGAFYSTVENKVFVPKGAQPLSQKALQAMARHSQALRNTPLASSLHEHGHAADHLSKRAISVANKPTLYRQTNKLAQRQRIVGKLEKRANVNVLKEIQKSGTPEEVKDWKRWANRQMHVYRNSFMQGLHERINDVSAIDRSLKVGNPLKLGETIPLAPLKEMPLSYKRGLLQEYPHLRKSATQLERLAEAKLRLRELASLFVAVD